MAIEIKDLQTPAVLLDLDVWEINVRKFADIAFRTGKQLWPMVKTHKSTELALFQMRCGATGMLCGTLDEAEAMVAAGVENVMYAYPVAGRAAINRVIALAKECPNFFIRLDGVGAAKQIDEYAARANTKIKYTIIIDCGLHRFGVSPEEAADLTYNLSKYENMQFMGISTHPGHVYGATTPIEVAQCARQEVRALEKAKTLIEESGFKVRMVTTGSTPTFNYNIDKDGIDIFHPGNYMFNDAIQVANGTVTEDECALMVMATVIAHPSEDRYIIDAGAKCFGLDRGAHGNDSIVGYGIVKGHPELVLSGLSEEVGILSVLDKTNISVGSPLLIVPNHSCTVANMTSHIIGARGKRIERVIDVDIRGNSGIKGVSAII